MDVRHLSLLRELAERGSATAVAAATHRTASAVSQQLRSAERDLGVRLVEPAGRGLRLTDAGRLLAEGAVDVESSLARLEARLDEFRGRYRYNLLDDNVRRFNAEVPQIWQWDPRGHQQLVVGKGPVQRLPLRREAAAAAGCARRSCVS